MKYVKLGTICIVFLMLMIPLAIISNANVEIKNQKNKNIEEETPYLIGNYIGWANYIGFAKLDHEDDIHEYYDVTFIVWYDIDVDKGFYYDGDSFVVVKERIKFKFTFGNFLIIRS